MIRVPKKAVFDATLLASEWVVMLPVGKGVRAFGAAKLAFSKDDPSSVAIHSLDGSRVPVVVLLASEVEIDAD